MILHSGGLTLPFSAAIFALAEGEGAIARWLSSRVMVYLGEISYGVYILQAPIKELMEHFAGETGGLIKPVLTLALSVIIPAIAFTLVEKPARDLILGWSKKRRLATQGS
jgi:peptidoglycan/LPS O-acetylase OafA/YrhL